MRKPRKESKKKPLSPTKPASQISASAISGGTDIVSTKGEMVLYPTEDGSSRVECRLEEETLWLSQAALVELYQTTKANISLHLKHIFEEGELTPEAVVKSYLTTAADGKRYNVKHYRLEVVLAVGYRVRSIRGTQFRQWATARLEEYLRKGFSMDDERLKNPPGPGVPDYFDELLERIRDIRASEKRMYLRVREIFALAADYTPGEEETNRFFQIIQNKLHFAATGQTAPELIHDRVDHTKPNMGLKTWKGQVVRKADVTVAKNYLVEAEIEELNRIVSMFLDYAEDQAKKRKQVFMRDWQEKLDGFLAFNERRILPNAGKLSREQANDRALKEYERFENRRRALAEAEGEKSLRELEQKAKKLPKK